MKLKVFTLHLGAKTGAFDDSALTSFLAERDVIAVDEHFFVHDGAPRWALLVQYRDEPPRARRQPSEEPAQDWRADLSAGEADLFSALRTWRNNRARRDGRPAFVLFTNRQLAAIARLRPESLAELATVPGVGEARVRDYGESVLGVVRAATEPPPATPAGEGGDESPDEAQAVPAGDARPPPRIAAGQRAAHRQPHQSALRQPAPRPGRSPRPVAPRAGQLVPLHGRHAPLWGRSRSAGRRPRLDHRVPARADAARVAPAGLPVGASRRRGPVPGVSHLAPPRSPGPRPPAPPRSADTFTGGGRATWRGQRGRVDPGARCADGLGRARQDARAARQPVGRPPVHNGPVLSDPTPKGLSGSETPSPTFEPNGLPAGPGAPLFGHAASRRATLARRWMVTTCARARRPWRPRTWRRRELAGRKPRLLLRLAGVFLLRFAARQLPAVLFQLQPRLTRLEPPVPSPCRQRCWRVWRFKAMSVCQPIRSPPAVCGAAAVQLATATSTS